MENEVAKKPLLAISGSLGFIAVPLSIPWTPSEFIRCDPGSF
jgi:hypothetical protein